MTGTGWRKSTYSVFSGCCVEVSPGAGTVLVRDSKDTAGPVLEFTEQAWARLTGWIKSTP